MSEGFRSDPLGIVNTAVEEREVMTQFINAFWLGTCTNAFCGGTMSLKELCSKTSHIWCSGQIPVVLVPCWNECVVQVRAVILGWQPDEAAAPPHLSLAQNRSQQCLWEASCGTARDLLGWGVTRIWLGPLFSTSSITWEIPEPCHLNQQSSLKSALGLCTLIKSLACRFRKNLTALVSERCVPVLPWAEGGSGGMGWTPWV